MSYRLRVWPTLPEGTAEELAVSLNTGMYHNGIVITAAWDDANNKCVGWVVPGGAELYAKKTIEPLGMRWEVEEFDEGI